VAGCPLPKDVCVGRDGLNPFGAFVSFSGIVSLLQATGNQEELVRYEILIAASMKLIWRQ
jgi:hypothetical protein